ncbi:MAG: FeoB-associated Cys-rich membrane protein [Treponema sp.]|nr:FeoB-associated Cys-rich membrane protein [Treponema sp.]
MGMIVTVVLGALIAAAFVLAVVRIIKKRKSGGCSCGCGGCGGCDSCGKK